MNLKSEGQDTSVRPHAALVDAAVEAAMAEAEEMDNLRRLPGTATIGVAEIWQPTCGLRILRTEDSEGMTTLNLQQLWKDCYSSATEWRDVEVVNEP